VDNRDLIPLRHQSGNANGALLDHFALVQQCATNLHH
jgi:hypothetical protein